MIQPGLLALARELQTAPVSRVRSRDQNMVSVKKKHNNEGRKLSTFNTKRQGINGRKCKTKIAAHLFCVTVTSAGAAPADDAAPQFFVPVSCSKLWVQKYCALVFSEQHSQSILDWR